VDSRGYAIVTYLPIGVIVDTKRQDERTKRRRGGTHVFWFRDGLYLPLRVSLLCDRYTMTENDTDIRFTTPVESVCEIHDCSNTAQNAYVVTGDIGSDGVAVYCSEHSAQMDRSDNHTEIGVVCDE